MRNKLFRLASSTIVAGVMASIVLNAMPQAAMADPAGDDFTSWTAENPLTDAQAEAKGWSYNYEGARDVAIVANGINGNSLRMSNAVMDRSFGNWLFSEPVATPATETGNQEFVAEFDIKSMTPGAIQPGLQISMAPQTAGGARMSFLKFVDTQGGINVEFADYANDGVNGRQIVIDTLDRAVQHHVKMVIDLYDGPSNDVVQVFIDDPQMTNPLVPATGSIDRFYAPVDHPDVAVNKAKAGQTIPLKFKLTAEPATTWEDYYRFNPESNGGVDPEDWTTRPIDSLIFQARGADGSTTPGVDGLGFLIDNVVTTSSLSPTLPTGAAGDASLLGPNPFTAQRVDCNSDEPMDTLETYAAGASGLTYNATTGIWHYNWQTRTASAGNCVKMTLNLTSDYALFKFTR